MKKIMLSAAMLAFAGMATVNANPIQPIGVHVMAVQDERTPIKIEELPEAVKTSLSGEDYAGWAPTEAFAVTPASGAKYYEVSLSKDGETKVANFDESGSAVVAPDTDTQVEAPAQEPVEAPAQEPTETPAPDASQAPAP